MKAEQMADTLTAEMQATVIPRKYWCPMATAMENMLRDAKGRGPIWQRIGLALALEAIKAFRAKECGS